MDTRYHIEEMVSQDTNGVVFQGMDSVTGVIVAMRRFISAGGCDKEVGENERQAYIDAITTLKKVTHPSLRRVLAGGCDPVDEMPYLVTRWADGTPLGEIIASEGAIDTGFARHILGQLLDANTAIVDSLECDGLWLEATLESVIVRPPRDESESAVALFWLCPWRWLHSNGSTTGMMGLADLAEAMLGGPRKIAADHHPADELPKWIRRIRSNEIPNLEQAQEELLLMGGTTNPLAANETPKQEAASGAKADDSIRGFDPPGLQMNQPLTVPLTAARGLLPSEPNHHHGFSRTSIAAVATLSGLIILVVWIAMSREKPEPPPTEESPFSSSPNQNQARLNEMMSRIDVDNSASEERLQHIQRRGFYTIEEADLLLGRDADEVTFRGRLARVRMSSSGLTMYLEFSDEAPSEEPRAYAMTRNLVDGIRPEDFERSVGRQIEIRGPIDIETAGEVRRPRVKIIDPDRINVLEADEDYELR